MNQDDGIHIYKETAIRLWSRIQGQFSAILSTIIFSELINSTQVLETGIVSVVSCLTYLSMDGFARKSIDKLYKNRDSKVWKEVLMGMLDFTYAVCLFITIQFINRATSSTTSSQNFSFLEEMVVLFSLVIIILSVIRILKDANAPADQYLIVDLNTESFMSLWDRLFGTFVQFFSIFTLQRLVTLSNQGQVGITVTTFTFSYIIFDSFVRSHLKNFYFTRYQPEYRLFLSDVMDFLYVYFIFLFIQYVTILLSNEIGGGGYSFLEQLVVIFALVIVIFSSLTVLRQFDVSTNSGINPSETVNRIWPKISGTLTGIISIAVKVYIGATGRDGELTLVVISVFMLYAMSDGFLRSRLRKHNWFKRNIEWFEVVEELLDFLYGFGFLFFVDAISVLLIQNSGFTNSLLEKLAIIYSIALVVWSVFVSIKFS